MDASMKQELLGEIRALLRKRAEDRLHAPASGNHEESEGGEGPGETMEGEEDSSANISQEPTEEEELDEQDGDAPCAYCGEGTGGGRFCKSCGHRLGGKPMGNTKSARNDDAEE